MSRQIENLSRKRNTITKYVDKFNSISSIDEALIQDIAGIIASYPFKSPNHDSKALRIITYCRDCTEHNRLSYFQLDPNFLIM